MDYSARDYSRYDSFDLTEDARNRHGYEKTDPTTPLSPSATYFWMFRFTVESQILAKANNDYLHLQTASGQYDDFYGNLVNKNDFDVRRLVLAVTPQINQAYNTYRASRLAVYRQASCDKTNADLFARNSFDTETITFRGLSSLQSFIVWFESLLTVHLNRQDLVSTSPTYGLFHDTKGNYPSDPFWWKGADFGFFYGHYLQLLSPEMIRRIRASSIACLSALSRFLPPDFFTTATIESQWLLQVAGYNLYAYTLQRCDRELTRRGLLTEPPVDMTPYLTKGEKLMSDFALRTNTRGWVEYSSTYVNFHLNNLSLLLLHPLSPTIYALATSCYRRYHWDLLANWEPNSASFPSVSGRSYDLFAGCYTQADTFEQPIYYAHPYRPQSNVVVRTGSDGSKVTKTLSLPAPIGSSLIPITYSNFDSPYPRYLYTIAQCGGEGLLPYGLMQSNPSRQLEQRYTSTVGQERITYTSSGYSLSHSGQDVWLKSLSNNFNIRLAGIPNGPVQIYPNGPAPCLSYLRFFYEDNGNPFARTSPTAPAGNDLSLLSSPLTVSYQGFALCSHFLTPTIDTATGKTWTANIILPLGADQLWANSMKLSKSPVVVGVGGRRVFTARHGNYSAVIRLVSYDSDGSNPWVNWTVDADGVTCGAGKISLVIKGPKTSNRPYRLTYLVGCGLTRTDAEMTALQNLIGNATVNEQVTTSGKWDVSNQPLNGSTSVVGSSTWKGTATLPGLTLRLERTDNYLPWNNSPIYRDASYAPLHAQPYYLSGIVRQVNGVEQYRWNQGEEIYRVRNYADSEIYAPHLGVNQVVSKNAVSYS